MDKTSISTIDTKTKVLAIASFGGHFVQLLRITKPLEQKYNIFFISTAKEAKSESIKNDFYVIDDFSRTDPWKIIKTIRNILKIIKKEKPQIVISTGAAPGLSAILVAKFIGIPTIWIDSIANADCLSMCGKIASKIADRTYTQWKHLANEKIQYSGSVF